MLRTTLLLLPLVVLVAFVLSCGIPQTVYLPPVDSVTVELGSVAVFEHDTSNYPSGNFQGYEVYYKFYSFDTDLEEGPFADDRQTLMAASPGTAAVKSAGYYRVTEQGNPQGGDPPLIEIDLGEPDERYDIRLEFPITISTSYEIVATWLDDAPEESPVNLVRDPNVNPLLGELTFEPDDIRLDVEGDDVPENITAFSGKIHMGLVVLAYGIDYERTFAQIYSQPVVSEEPLEIIIQE